MPAKRKPSDDPVERQRQFILAREALEAARDQIALDRHAGRTPSIGAGALEVLKKRVEDTQAAVQELQVPTST